MLTESLIVHENVYDLSGFIQHTLHKLLGGESGSGETESDVVAEVIIAKQELLRRLDII